MSGSRKKVLYAILMVGISVWFGFICFYHLGESGIQNTDEARHIVNAYEMLKSGNIWINTYRYATDYYNFKPPFSMWCIMLNFKLFGISLFSARLYAAVSMFLMYVVLLCFLWRKFSASAAFLFGVIFSGMTDMLFFHSARSADADATYLLFYTVAMLLIYLSEEHPGCFAWAGLALSLAFLTKCFHVVSAFAILVCYLPRIYKKLDMKKWAGFVLLFAVPTGIWSVIRLRYDGFAFFAGMMGQEVTDRIKEGKNYTAYFMYLLQNPVTAVVTISLLAMLLYLVIRFIVKKEKMTPKTILGYIIKNDCYLFVLWAVIPFMIYSASGAYMEWYSYIFLIPVCVLSAVKLTAVISGRTGKAEKVVGLLVLAGVLVCTGIQVRKTIWNLSTLKYECNIDVRNNLDELIEKRPDLKGAEIYIENSRQEYKKQNEWEQNSIADAYLAGDLDPQDGGVPVFLDDQDALLIISKDLFPQYADVLSGRVILVDGNDYLIFCNEFY